MNKTETFLVFRQNAKDFLVWWKEGLSYLVPSKIKQYLNNRYSPLVMSIRQTGLELGAITTKGDYLLIDNSETKYYLQAEQYFLSKLRRLIDEYSVFIVIIPNELGLIVNLKLPHAARKDLQKIVYFEIERNTPFSADNVFYAYRIINATKRSAYIDVQLDVVPKKQAIEILEWLNRNEIAPNILALEHQDSSPVEYMEKANLLPKTIQNKKYGASRRLNMALFLIIIVLLCLAFIMPIYSINNKINILEERLAEAKQNAHEIKDLLSEYQDLLSISLFLHDKKNKNYPAIVTISKISELLPDDTYLTRLDINENSLRLHGKSKSASSLIRTLENEKMFVNVEFRAPVTSNRNSEYSTFSIAADLSSP